MNGYSAVGPEGCAQHGVKGITLITVWCNGFHSFKRQLFPESSPGDCVRLLTENEIGSSPILGAILIVSGYAHHSKFHNTGIVFKQVRVLLTIIRFIAGGRHRVFAGLINLKAWGGTTAAQPNSMENIV